MNEKRTPLSTHTSISIEEIEKIERLKSYPTWQSMTIKSIFNGGGIYFTQLMLILLLSLAYGKSIIISLSTLLYLESSGLFTIAGMIIWFGPSPSLQRFKSGITGTKYSIVSTTKALRSGYNKMIMSITLFIFSIFHENIFS